MRAVGGSPIFFLISGCFFLLRQIALYNFLIKPIGHNGKSASLLTASASMQQSVMPFLFIRNSSEFIAFLKPNIGLLQFNGIGDLTNFQSFAMLSSSLK